MKKWHEFKTWVVDKELENFGVKQESEIVKVMVDTSRIDYYREDEMDGRPATTLFFHGGGYIVIDMPYSEFKNQYL